MRVYHGSYKEIIEIDLSQCEIGKDFGQGFYVTNIKEQAQFWAKRKGLDNGTNGYVTEFDFNENAFLHFDLKVLRFAEYNENWLDFVAENRNVTLQHPVHDYDIVEGPVADDKIATRIKKYLRGGISKEQFLEELKFIKHTHQICFCTGRSLQMLDYVGKTKNIEYQISEMGEPLIEQLIIDFNIDEETASDKFYSSNTFGKLADPSTELYKKSWQEIYEMLKLELKK
ncbi:DUF3990 domain-containing protein [Bacteroidales bacterium OttesenSCG-928-K03]|nr:DUF3990 domain-containing protein [Odoribacter sp. OttesenSCG-928-L07]MDL2238808.1 DUF3990 domain-containing protein [Bacteroidales bacterium OttesenSCG-928-L14]MDL2240986.1 DUF3990 domain-containing protein [Bacteroidales bacterium OttesenSCG-928-K22]MDL2242187.1 DUF3990 domain-containing protein [Bacteroidales bacterium OttesenSCG-928-K03]